jgi:endo-1,4-beta-xylanase
MPTQPFSAESRNTQTLRQAADEARVLIGTAVRPEQLTEQAYAATLARQYNLLEPENAMKWDAVHPAPDKFDFSQADRIVAFAAEHNMKVRGHTLVWHQQNPAWLAGGGYSPAALSGILENHIKTIVGHYRGKVFAWDVANEAYDEIALGKLRSTLWYDSPGIGFARKGSFYLEQCFRWAHEADPEALLFYNEAEAEAVNAKSDAIFAMDLLRQAEIYRQIASACFSHPGCSALQTWGFTDKYSWIGSHSHHTQGAALPFDRDYHPKPAHASLLVAMRQVRANLH